MAFPFTALLYFCRKNMPSMKSFFLLGAAFFLALSSLFSQNIDEKKLRKHVTFLASDKLKGRGTGSPEERKAAEYLAKQFKKIGRQPKSDDGTYLHRYGFKRSADAPVHASKTAKHD